MYYVEGAKKCLMPHEVTRSKLLVYRINLLLLPQQKSYWFTNWNNLKNI